MELRLAVLLACAVYGAQLAPDESGLLSDLSAADRVERLPDEQQVVAYRRKLLAVAQDLAGSFSRHDRSLIQQMSMLRVSPRPESAVSFMQLEDRESSRMGVSLEGQEGEALDIQPIMKSITKLEDKIKAERDIDSASHSLMDATCYETDRKMAKVLADEEASQKLLKMDERQMRNQRTQDRADLKASQELERRLSKTLHELRSELQAKQEAYYGRRRQRTRDLEALQAAVRLVCTFASFTDDERCKKDKFVESVPNPGTTELFAAQSEKSLMTEAKEVRAASESAWEAQQAKDLADIHKGKIPVYLESFEMSRETSLLQLAQKSAVTDKVLRRQLGYHQLSEPAKGPVAALLLSVEAGDYEKAVSLLELILGLIKTITDEQIADKQKWGAEEMELKWSVSQNEAALYEEQQKQDTLEDSIRTLSNSIEVNRANFFRSVKATQAASKRREQNNLTCDEERAAYRQRKRVADEELMNINKLRSLLQVLDGEGVPTCGGEMDDCTSAEHGMCIKKNSKQNMCACEPGYYGEACDQKKCPGQGELLYQHDEAGACSGASRGTCDSKVGKCTCTDEFEGAKCEVAKSCPGGGNCNMGHGRCDKATGKCHCYQGWFGAGCTEQKCPGPTVTEGGGEQLYDNGQEEVCSGHGVCITSSGQCGCHEGWESKRCDKKQCGDNCSGNGECMSETGTCSCKKGHHGPTCAYKECPAGCSGFGGTCNRMIGACVCNRGFSGPACEQTTTCNERETTYQEWAFWKPGWSKCPYGWLMRGVVTASCTGIHCIDKAICAKPCLGKSELGIERCYQENWWDSLNTKGWSRCAEGYYLAGLYRNKCNSLYCVEMALCCSIRDAEYDHCQELDWFETIKMPNAKAEVQPNKFMTGVYRAGITTQISDLRKVSSCHFKSTKMDSDDSDEL